MLNDKKPYPISATAFLSAMECTRPQHRIERASRIVTDHWVPPHSPSLKVNADVSWQVGSTMTWVAGVVRNHVSEFVAAQ